jgi:hypothetical protein
MAHRAKINLRLARVLEAGNAVLRSEWAGAIVLCGPIVGGDSVTVNLWCEPGRARLVAHWGNGQECRMTPSQIAARLKQRMLRLRIVND